MTFKADRSIRIATRDHTGRNVSAMSIEGTGGILVITAFRDDADLTQTPPYYCITHTLTGWRLGPVSTDVANLIVTARSFWRLLTPAQRKVWMKEKNPTTCRKAASKPAVAVLKKGYA